MNGKARSEPGNHVEWANKFKSNMPDWPTARKCAVVDDMLFMLKECRAVLLAVDIIQDQPGIAQWRVSEHIDQSRFNAILDRVQKVITLAEFGPPDQTLGQPDGIAKKHPLEGLIRFTEDNKRMIIDTRPPLPPPSAEPEYSSDPVRDKGLEALKELNTRLLPTQWTKDPERLKELVKNPTADEAIVQVRGHFPPPLPPPPGFKK